jgi:hypothetical protein
VEPRGRPPLPCRPQIRTTARPRQAWTRRRRNTRSRPPAPPARSEPAGGRVSPGPPPRKARATNVSRDFCAKRRVSGEPGMSFAAEWTARRAYPAPAGVGADTAIRPSCLRSAHRPPGIGNSTSATLSSTSATDRAPAPAWCQPAGRTEGACAIRARTRSPHMWVADHVVLPDPPLAERPMAPDLALLDPIVALTFLAAHTTRILLGTGVIILPQRQALVLAKQLASLDVLSSGRVILRARRRLVRARDALGRRLLSRPRPHRRRVPGGHAGGVDPVEACLPRTYVSFEGVQAMPRPVQATVPITREDRRGRGSDRAPYLGTDIDLRSGARVGSVAWGPSAPSA